MQAIRVVPTEAVSEQLSVGRLGEALGVRRLRADVFRLAEGSTSPRLRGEDEALYLVLDGTAMIDVDDEEVLVGERELIAVPARSWHRVQNIGVGSLTYYAVGAVAADDAADGDG